MFRILALYISFVAEFNADPEYVHGFWVYFIPKDFWVKNHVFGTFTGVLKVLWASKAKINRVIRKRFLSKKVNVKESCTNSLRLLYGFLNFLT